MKSFRSKYFIFTLSALLLTSCQSIWHQPIPDSEIVYQIESPEEYKLGFVNADGTNQNILNVGKKLEKPVWSTDGELVYSLAGKLYPSTIGYPAYWDSDGEFNSCRKWGYFSDIEGTGNQDDPKEAIVSDARTIRLVDLEQCKIIKILVDLEKRGDWSAEIRGISYFPDNHELLYGKQLWGESHQVAEYQIIKLDLKTGEEEKIAEGINPSWSPDGTRIAYVQPNGIYIMHSDGAQPRQLKKIDFITSDTGYPLKSLIPIPRWSPNGEWIIYHSCYQSECFNNKNTLYKINIESGQEEEIITGGSFPDWR